MDGGSGVPRHRPMEASRGGSLRQLMNSWPCSFDWRMYLDGDDEPVPALCMRTAPACIPRWRTGQGRIVYRGNELKHVQCQHVQQVRARNTSVKLRTHSIFKSAQVLISHSESIHMMGAGESQ